MGFFGKIMAGAAIAASAGAAAAQHPMVLDRLRQINEQAPQPAAEQIRAAVAATAAAIGEANRVCVPTEIAVTEVTPVTGARDVLQGALTGQIRNGWVAYATHGGCADAGPFRYMILQRPDGTLVAPQVNQGRSIANPSIMRDTSVHAALGALHKAREGNPECDGREMSMGPTRVVSESADLGPDVYGVRYTGSWTEVWRFTTCGRTFDVPVEFRADGDGGAYTNVAAHQVAAVDR